VNEENKVFIGIDVSKAVLDISLSGNHFQIKNTKKAISSFIFKEIFNKNIQPSLVCLESTGGYEVVAMQCFQAEKIAINRAHPNRVHSFAKASGHFAKTDKLDAKLLEKYAAFVSADEEGDDPLEEDLLDLQELKSIERDLMESLHANQCRIKICHSKKAVSYLKKQINFIQDQLKKIRKNIEEAISSDNNLKQKRDLLMTHKGVAFQTSNSLIIELPELGRLTNKEIAALVGVAPKTYESGMKKSKGHIMGGRFYVRKSLYMAALVACRHDQKLRTFYNRLIAAGKAKKVALVAVIRKIIICLNAMLKNNNAYQEIYA